jgi:PAS domain S-box-containing protein
VNRVIAAGAVRREGTEFIAWTGDGKSILFSIDKTPKLFFEVFPKPYIISFFGVLSLVGLYALMVSIKSRRIARILFDSIYTDASRGIIWIDQEDRIFKINDKALEILGAVDGRVVGSRYQDLPANAGTTVLSQIKQKLDHSEDSTYSGDFKLPTETGEQEFSVQVSRIGDSGSRDLGSLVVMEDVSALSKAKTLETWSVLTRGLSHGIKNPLALAKAKLKTLPRRDTDESNLEAILENLDEAARYSERLSRIREIHSSEKATCDVNQVTKEVILRKRLALPENVEVEAFLAHEEIEANIDETLLQSILSELVDNALDAVRDKERGRVNLSARRIELERKESLRSGTNARIRIEVADNGRGIPEEVKDSLFTLGSTTKGTGHTGTGLFYVKTVIEQRGGSLESESETGAGTRFIIHLPANKEKE